MLGALCLTFALGCLSYGIIAGFIRQEASPPYFRSGTIVEHGSRAGVAGVFWILFGLLALAGAVSYFRSEIDDE